MSGAGDVFLVDDNPNNLSLLAGILRGAGYRVRMADSPRRALGMLQALPPELVLLDITMPELDGYEVCRELKAAPATREVPVIFISALSEPLDKVKAFGAGGVDYVSKPFDAEEVLARVATHLRIHRLQREVLQKNQELERLAELKNRFLGIAAHDMRNPLTAILGMSELLMAEPGLAAGVADFVRRIHVSAEFMLRLVEDLLDLAAIESGRLRLERTSVPLLPLLRDCVAMHALLAARKQIAVKLDASDETLVADADPTRIEQVVGNLIGNAVKFSQAGTQVRVTLARDEGAARVSVEDQGQGIPEAELAGLFEPFSPGSVKATAGEKSTGLGLAIVRKIVTEHGGRIWAESEPGWGTRFHFTLPLAGQGLVVETGT